MLRSRSRGRSSSSSNSNDTNNNANNDDIINYNSSGSIDDERPSSTSSTTPTPAVSPRTRKYKSSPISNMRAKDDDDDDEDLRSLLTTSRPNVTIVRPHTTTTSTTATTVSSVDDNSGITHLRTTMDNIDDSTTAPTTGGGRPRGGGGCNRKILYFTIIIGMAVTIFGLSSSPWGVVSNMEAVVDRAHDNDGRYEKNDNVDEKSGTRRRKGEERQNGGSGGGGGIGDVIHAIENMFTVDHDKSSRETTSTASSSSLMHKQKRKKKKKKKHQRADDDAAAAATPEGRIKNIIPGGTTTKNLEIDPEVIVPVVKANDDILPANADALDAYAYALPASDTLLCRASVISFVINATDVRDECDGLRRAFDKACSVQERGATADTTLSTTTDEGVDDGSSSGSTEIVKRRLLDDATTADTIDEERQWRGRGRLSKWGTPKLAWDYRDSVLHDMISTIVSRNDGNMMSSSSSVDVDPSSLFAYFDGHERRGLRDMKDYVDNEEEEGGGENINHGEEEEGALSEETVVLAKQDQEQQQQQQEQQVEEQRPLISLNIPTSNKHISEGMLNEALLLQQTDVDTTSDNREDDEEDVIHVPPSEREVTEIETVTTNDNNNNNKLNITADAAAAVKDVAESANAIRTAVEGVQKSMMNDPKSVEARTCCASILSVFHEHCDPTTTGVEDYSDQRLLVVVFVITVCGVVKSIIRHLHIRWLPEAGGCILVGVLGYLILQHMPHVRFAFDGDMFLRIMVPPIVFEAAVKINKQSFRRHVIPITIFAIVGTLASTAFTAFILHRGSLVFGHYVPMIPVKESLIFGALISSIDPIAVLSVLSSMGMTDTDTIYVLIFGESLLNDGVAIVLFQTLVHFLDETLVIDSEVMLDAFMHFVVVALGSVSVGMLSGACATLYFSLMHGCQTPMVEVIMFLCWSFVPYYICDMVEWSGIVAIVANGFVMDLYVIGQKHQQHHQHKATNSDVDEEIDYLVNGNVSSSSSNTSGRMRPYRQQKCRSIFTFEGHLSSKADVHVHFVIEIFATLMETAIFAYLGLFLFSSRYHWSLYLSLMSIFATVLGRVIMIPLFSQVANILNRMNLSSGHHYQSNSTVSPLKANEGVHIDRRMQVVLIFAGLRGAMSFALVEHIPMFDTTTGQGSRLKPELKAMTSASIIFTLFVLGGSTSYLMERLGYSVKKQQGQDDVEIVSLLSQHDDKRSPLAKKRDIPQASDASLRSNGSVRQRGFNLSR